MIIPGAYILVIIGVLTLLLAHTVIGGWLAIVLQQLSCRLCDFVQWVEHFPYATLQLSVTPWMVVCLVVAIAFCYLRIRQQRLVWFAPAVASITLFCCLHVQDTKHSLDEHALAFRGKTMYYHHGGVTQQYRLDKPYMFFHYDGEDYVYAPYLSPRKQQALTRYCLEKHILLRTTDGAYAQ